MLMQKEGALLIGACNFLNRLDPAITRPGRFDLIVEMPQPSAAGFYAILAGHFPTGFEDNACGTSPPAPWVPVRPTWTGRPGRPREWHGRESGLLG